VWWWLPREAVHGFKGYAERMTEGGRGELYTKSISPFLTDREERPPEQVLPLQVGPLGGSISGCLFAAYT
jgi:hypothetical protein